MYHDTPSLTPCRCWSCRKELGQSDGTSLILNERASIRRPQTIWCTCGGATFWRPVKKAEATIVCADYQHAQ